VLLGKEDFLLRAMCGTPLADAALQSPQHAWGEGAGMPAL